MSQLVSRAYTGASDLNLLIKFAQRAAGARWPRSTYKKIGDVVWMMRAPGCDPCADIRMWFDGSDVVAYGWFEPPLSLDFDIMPGLLHFEPVGGEILEWADSRCRRVAQSGDATIPRAFAMLGYRSICLTEVLESDGERISLLSRHGYAPSDGFGVLYRRSLADPITLPALDPSLRLRHAVDDDLEERVDLHCDSWSAWGSSTWTAAERLSAVESYRWLRSAPAYDQELDVVLEDSHGRLLAYCIGWLDAANGFGHFEPVGCRPAFTRRGCARAVVTIEGIRRMRTRGMHTALVATAGVNEAARALYPSCGFVEVERAQHYIKRIAD